MSNEAFNGKFCEKMISDDDDMKSDFAWQVIITSVANPQSSAGLHVLIGTSLQLIAFTWHQSCKIIPD